MYVCLLLSLSSKVRAHAARLRQPVSSAALDVLRDPPPDTLGASVLAQVVSARRASQRYIGSLSFSALPSPAALECLLPLGPLVGWGLAGRDLASGLLGSLAHLDGCCHKPLPVVAWLLAGSRHGAEDPVMPTGLASQL